MDRVGLEQLLLSGFVRDAEGIAGAGRSGLTSSDGEEGGGGMGDGMQAVNRSGTSGVGISV